MIRINIALAALVSSSLVSGCSATTGTTSRLTEPSLSTSSAEMFIGDAADRMDDQARSDYLVAQLAALDDGEVTAFWNDTMGAQGQIDSGPSALTALYPGMECKSYSAVVWVLGSGQLVQGDACRDQDGPWHAMGIRNR